MSEGESKLFECIILINIGFDVAIEKTVYKVIAIDSNEDNMNEF